MFINTLQKGERAFLNTHFELGTVAAFLQGVVGACVTTGSVILSSSLIIGSAH